MQTKTPVLAINHDGNHEAAAEAGREANDPRSFGFDVSLSTAIVAAGKPREATPVPTGPLSPALLGH